MAKTTLDGLDHLILCLRFLVDTGDTSLVRIRLQFRFRHRVESLGNRLGLRLRQLVNPSTQLLHRRLQPGQFRSLGAPTGLPGSLSAAWLAVVAAALREGH
jgi:hypothetical protein